MVGDGVSTARPRSPRGPARLLGIRDRSLEDGADGDDRSYPLDGDIRLH